MASAVAKSQPSAKANRSTRKPFRSISQVLDTPVTPDLLAALPAPVQQSALMMGPKLNQMDSNPVDAALVNAAMASFTGTANILVAADSEKVLDLFKGLAAQLPMKLNLKMAVGKQQLIAELNNAAKAIVEGTGSQMDLVLCDPEVVKQDGQLVSTLHSKYSVPVALFSSTSEAVHTHLVDDWLKWSDNYPCEVAATTPFMVELAALILKWHAKSNGAEEPTLRQAQPGRSQQPMAIMASPYNMTPQGAGIQGNGVNSGQSSFQPVKARMQNELAGLMQTYAGMQMESQPAQGPNVRAPDTLGGAAAERSMPNAGSSPHFEPLVAVLKEEIKSLKAEVVEKKRMLATVVKDPKKITAKMFKSGEGKKLGEQLISEMSKLRTEKEHLLHAKEKARKAQEAKAATARKLAEEKEAKLQAEQMELERKRQEEEAASRKKAAQEAARSALTPAERRMNAFALMSHACNDVDAE